MLQVRNRSAFTLIELLVVVIIVAVLAAVGVPLLSANVQRARASEAEAGLGSIRTGMRARLAEVGTFTAVPTLAQIGINVTPGAVPGGDLDGRFFDDTAYSITAAAGTTYCIVADGALSNALVALRAAQVQGTNLVQRAMDENGTICNGTACGCATPLN